MWLFDKLEDQIVNLDHARFISLRRNSIVYSGASDIHKVKFETEDAAKAEYGKLVWRLCKETRRS